MVSHVFAIPYHCDLADIRHHRDENRPEVDGKSQTVSTTENHHRLQLHSSAVEYLSVSRSKLTAILISSFIRVQTN